MKPKIWLERTLIPEALAQLRPVAEIIERGDESNLPGAAAVVISSITNANGAFMDRIGPQLKVIARTGIGVDNIDRKAASERGILIVHTPDAPTESTAEHAVALLMAVAKRVMLGDRQLRAAGQFDRSQLMGTELRGRVLGVIGFGRIGSRVAEICGPGLGMRLIAHDPYLTDHTRAEKLDAALVDDLNALLSAADFVTIHTALTPETRHLIGPAQLQQMKSGAYLINASRGPVVDEAALTQALADGHLAGAGLDVFDPEPPSPDNPLLSMPNVVATPHSAAFTDRGMEKINLSVAEQLVQIFQGQRPTFLFNPEAWPGRVGTKS